ncbi:hypothetical protein ANN_09183 [Periplaneta americana]|uniref:Reverse transcriptase domain-containing protein n=1 Tax=Periplaneta americana TaxID=6978 RepID=A0ABQ8TN62_PERAM|nr:hypothetical protein ANN_09183 [Periplaneta americana]
MEDLRFADDVVVFGRSPRELESVLQELSTQSRTAGLSMNMTKIKLVTNGLQSPITVDGTIVPYVNEYVYLGQQVCFEDRMEREIQRRIALT